MSTSALLDMQIDWRYGYGDIQAQLGEHEMRTEHTPEQIEWARKAHYAKARMNTGLSVIKAILFKRQQDGVHRAMLQQHYAVKHYLLDPSSDHFEGLRLTHDAVVEAFQITPDEFS